GVRRGQRMHRQMQVGEERDLHAAQDRRAAAAITGACVMSAQTMMSQASAAVDSRPVGNVAKTFVDRACHLFVSRGV
ncbi:MAG: hypothetical protein ABI156_10750, partial [Caldimonas sp.]